MKLMINNPIGSCRKLLIELNGIDKMQKNAPNKDVTIANLPIFTDLFLSNNK